MNAEVLPSNNDGVIRGRRRHYSTSPLFDVALVRTERVSYGRIFDRTNDIVRRYSMFNFPGQRNNRSAPLSTDAITMCSKLLGILVT